VLSFLDTPSSSSSSSSSSSGDVDRALKAVAELERLHDSIYGELHQLYWQYKYVQIRKTCDQEREREREREGALHHAAMPFLIPNGAPFLLSLTSQSMFSSVPESFDSIDTLMKHKVVRLEKLYKSIQDKVGWLVPLHSRLQRLRNYYLGYPESHASALSRSALGHLLGYDTIGLESALIGGGGSSYKKEGGSARAFDPVSCWKDVEEKRTEVYDLSLRAQEMDSIMYGTGNDVHVQIQISRAMRKLLMEWSELLERLKGHILEEEEIQLAPEEYPQTAKDHEETVQRRKDFQGEWTTIVQEFTMQQHVSDSDLRKLKDEIHHLQLTDRQAQKTMDKEKHKQEKESKTTATTQEKTLASASETSMSLLTDALTDHKRYSKSPVPTAATTDALADASKHARQTNLVVTQHKQLDVDSRMRASWIRSLERRHNLLRKFGIVMQWTLHKKSAHTARMCGGSTEAVRRLSQAVGSCWLKGLEQAYMEWKALGIERELIADCESEDKKVVDILQKKKNKKKKNNNNNNNNNSNSNSNPKGNGAEHGAKNLDDNRTPVEPGVVCAAEKATAEVLPSASDEDGNQQGSVVLVQMNQPGPEKESIEDPKHSTSTVGVPRKKKRQSCTGGFKSENGHIDQPPRLSGSSSNSSSSSSRKRELTKEDEEDVRAFLSNGNSGGSGGHVFAGSLAVLHPKKESASSSSDAQNAMAPAPPPLQNQQDGGDASGGKRASPKVATATSSSPVMMQSIPHLLGSSSPRQNGHSPRHNGHKNVNLVVLQEIRQEDSGSLGAAERQQMVDISTAAAGTGFVFGDFVIGNEADDTGSENIYSLQNGERKDVNEVHRVATSTSRGLTNLDGDNSCFVNVVIQALWHLASFQTAFRNSLALSSNNARTGKQNLSSTNRSNPVKNFAISAALKSLFFEMETSGKESISSKELRGALFSNLKGKNGGHFRAGMMNDATETHETILEQLHHELLEDDPEPRQAIETNANTGKTCNDSLVNRVFGIHVKERFICPLCHAASDSRYIMTRVQYVHTTQIYSEKTKGPHLSFDEILGKLCEGDQQSCAVRGCRLQRKVHAKKFLVQLPSVFTIGLVWKSIQPTDEELDCMLRTLDLEIDLSRIFEVEQQDSPVDARQGTFSSVRLRLRGMFCFFGHHYMAIFFDEQCGQWLSLNDAEVLPIGDNWHHVVDSCQKNRFYPSLLFYEAQNYIPSRRLVRL
jgi:hypothetical protein